MLFRRCLGRISFFLCSSLGWGRRVFWCLCPLLTMQIYSSDTFSEDKETLPFCWKIASPPRHCAECSILVDKSRYCWNLQRRTYKPWCTVWIIQLSNGRTVHIARLLHELWSIKQNKIHWQMGRCLNLNGQKYWWKTTVWQNRQMVVMSSFLFGMSHSVHSTIPQ